MPTVAVLVLAVGLALASCNGADGSLCAVPARPGRPHRGAYGLGGGSAVPLWQPETPSTGCAAPNTRSRTH